MITKKQLVIKANFDIKNLTLDEMCLFSPNSDFDAPTFRDFLLEYTDWTKKEVGKIRGNELQEIATQISDELKRILVPKVSETLSENGPG